MLGDVLVQHLRKHMSEIHLPVDKVHTLQAPRPRAQLPGALVVPSVDTIRYAQDSIRSCFRDGLGVLMNYR